VPLLRGIMCSARHAELSSIQLRSVVHLSTLWPCTRNLLERTREFKVRELDMNLTSPF
jgi:hypothetical protein